MVFLSSLVKSWLVHDILRWLSGIRVKIMGGPSIWNYTDQNRKL